MQQHAKSAEFERSRGCCAICIRNCRLLKQVNRTANDARLIPFKFVQLEAKAKPVEHVLGQASVQTQTEDSSSVRRTKNLVAPANPVPMAEMDPGLSG